jgi:glutamate 5-kinase
MAKNGKTNGKLSDEVREVIQGFVNENPNVSIVAADHEEPDDTTIDIAAETLTGDMRDFMLDRLRHEQNKRPWHERSEAEQRDTVHQVESACREMARKAVEIIAAGGLRTIKATIEQVTVKDGIKATLTMSKFDENRHNLIDATGSTVLIVVADPEDFTGERAPVEIKPDNPGLPLDVHVVHSTEEAEAPFH